MEKIKVMVNDDSAFIGQTLSGILNHDPDIEVTSSLTKKGDEMALKAIE